MATHFSSLSTPRSADDSSLHSDEGTPPATPRTLNDEFTALLNDRNKAPILLPAKDYDSPVAMVKDEWKCRNVALVGGVKSADNASAIDSTVTVIKIDRQGKMNVQDASRATGKGNKPRPSIRKTPERCRSFPIEATTPPASPDTYVPHPIHESGQNAVYEIPDADYYTSESDDIRHACNGDAVKHSSANGVRYAGTGDDVPIDYAPLSSPRLVDNYQPRLPRFHFTS